MLPHTYSFQRIAIPFKNQICAPIFTSVVKDRTVGLMVAGAIGIQVGLTSLGLPGWPCPFLHVLGVPCPGCGLSRAIAALLHGDWKTSFELHAFAPVFVLALLLLLGATLLPQKQRNWLISRIELVERGTGITAILLIGLMLYWLIRLLLFPDAFINLIKG